MKMWRTGVSPYLFYGIIPILWRSDLGSSIKYNRKDGESTCRPRHGSRGRNSDLSRRREAKMEIPVITNSQPSGDDAKFWLHYSSADIKTAKRHRRSQFEMLRAEYETLFNSPISALHADAGGAAVATV